MSESAVVSDWHRVSVFSPNKKVKMVKLYQTSGIYGQLRPQSKDIKLKFLFELTLRFLFGSSMMALLGLRQFENISMMTKCEILWLVYH